MVCSLPVPLLSSTGCSDSFVPTKPLLSAIGVCIFPSAPTAVSFPSLAVFACVRCLQRSDACRPHRRWVWGCSPTARAPRGFPTSLWRCRQSRCACIYLGCTYIRTIRYSVCCSCLLFAASFPPRFVNHVCVRFFFFFFLTVRFVSLFVFGLASC